MSQKNSYMAHIELPLTASLRPYDPLFNWKMNSTPGPCDAALHNVQTR